VVSGKCDFAASDITVTQERAESVIFSEPVYRGGVVITVLNNDTETNPDQTGKSSGMSADLSDLPLDDLDGKRIGVQTGTNFEGMVQNRLPNAELFYFSNKADLISALSTNKIDSYVIDEPVIILEMQENDELTYIPEYLDTYDFAYVFPKNEEAEDLCEEFNEFLAEIKSDGRMDGLQKKWLSGDKSLWSIDDYGSFPATKGTLHLATETLYEPFEFIYEGKIMGFEIDLVVQFCKDYGYRLEIVNMNYDSVLPSIQSGKCEIGAAGISVTEERAESVLFSDPYYNGGTVMVVLKEEKSLPAEQPVSGGTSVFSSIKESFIKTFIREDRWKLFLEGVGITMLITLLSIFFGTIFGFLLFMLCRNGNPAANSITNTCLWLVQGMPGVVLLMILYYVIFGSSSISGIVVAVIGFTLIFGASVFGLLKIGVGTVDSGQYEAAFALGFSDIKTFFKIILPQALPHVMPAYKGEIISLLKATAIVGYIAVQDLTKMGDIVRSRTYEAFFPLIAVTIIYFLLEMFLGVIINRININIDMRKRNVKDILKGLTEND
jgi:polar amino acid transport system substrate-binding protein